MPVITVDIGPIPQEQKAELIKQYTKVSVDITGIPERAWIVLLHEIPHESVGVGGKILAHGKPE